MVGFVPTLGLSSMTLTSVEEAEVITPRPGEKYNPSGYRFIVQFFSPKRGAEEAVPTGSKMVFIENSA